MGRENGEPDVAPGGEREDEEADAEGPETGPSPRGLVGGPDDADSASHLGMNSLSLAPPSWNGFVEPRSSLGSFVSRAESDDG